MKTKRKKITKEEAGYIKRSATPLTCALCSMFRFPGRCRLVKGRIKGEGWCRYWERS